MLNKHKEKFYEQNALKNTSKKYTGQKRKNIRKKKKRIKTKELA